MPAPVYRVMTVLSALVCALPIGTNLGLLLVLWMLLRGELLTSRGAVLPGLSALGLSDAAVRRAWAAVRQGAWATAQLLDRWGTLVAQEGRWQAHTSGGYHPVAVDVTAIWRPRLRGCPTSHYSAEAGKALPAIPVGIVARVGSVDGQRFGLPLAFVRAPAPDPSPSAHTHALVRQAVALRAPDEALVFDRGFGVALLQQEGATAYVVRVPKNFTARRAQPPAYTGRGRPPRRGALVRPLPRRRGPRTIAATPPDHVTTWHEGRRLLRAEQWSELVLPDAPTGSPAFAVVAIHDARYATPLLLVSPLPLTPRQVRDLYRDRWPVEQLPLVAKQLLGATRQFVHASETRQRLPELALLAGAVLTYLAATQPAMPTGFWDRHPQRTPGRLRRLLARTPFPVEFPWPARLRQKAAVTAHLPKGAWGQRRRRASPATATAA